MSYWDIVYSSVETKRATTPYDPSVRYLHRKGQAANTSDFGDGRVAISDGYERCAWVYSCVRRKMDMVASRRWVVRTYEEGGAFTDDYLHPAAVRVNNPTLRTWDRTYQMSRAAGFLSVTGNAPFGKYGTGSDEEDPTRWLQQRGNELRIESPIGVTPIEDGLGGISRYDIDDGRSSWDPATIIHVMLPSLSSNFWGMSELQALAMTVDSDVEAHRWNLDSFGSGGMPTWLMVDYTLSEDGKSKAREDIAGVFQRRGRQREPWLIPGANIASGQGEPFRSAIELHKLGMTAQEMDWIAGTELGRDEIFVAMGFHPADASNDRATHDNSRVAQRKAWTGAAMPLLTAFGSWFTLKMLTEEERFAGMVIVPDLSDVEALQDSKSSVAESFEKLTRGGLSVKDAASFTGIQVSEEDEYEIPLFRYTGSEDTGENNEEQSNEMSEN